MIEQPANTRLVQPHTRDLHTWLLLTCAALLVAVHFAMAVSMSTPRIEFPIAPFIALVLLLLPAAGAWQGRGRAGFWYAMISTLFVAHAFVLAVADATQGFGFVLLAGSLALFVEACAFARHRGLAAD